MIIRFEVSNFKGFENPVSIDFTAREYEFNENMVKNGYVNKALIYGHNGSGKSSLGIALFDIISHLTDKERMSKAYASNYINLNSGVAFAKFKYEFLFDKDHIIYEYEKADIDDLRKEILTVNGQKIVDYDYFDSRNQFVSPDLSQDLNIELTDNKLSVLKYIYRNTPTNSYPVLTKMMQFCEGMLWYRCLSDGNAYCGFTNGNEKITDWLKKYGNLHEFEDFLRENELDYHLKFDEENGKNELFVEFSNGRAPFFSIASSGTRALTLFYVWLIKSFDNISFLFIDEFDAFLHYESSAYVIETLKKYDFQCIITTHNTYLMQNKLIRPDCCYLIKNNKVKCLPDCTDKEIREAHNLEKMYVNGVFDE